jgi:hypothetical protein
VTKLVVTYPKSELSLTSHPSQIPHVEGRLWVNNFKLSIICLLVNRSSGHFRLFGKGPMARINSCSDRLYWSIYESSVNSAEDNFWGCSRNFEEKRTFWCPSLKLVLSPVYYFVNVTLAMRPQLRFTLNFWLTCTRRQCRRQRMLENRTSTDHLILLVESRTSEVFLLHDKVQNRYLCDDTVCVKK